MNVTFNSSLPARNITKGSSRHKNGFPRGLRPATGLLELASHDLPPMNIVSVVSSSSFANLVKLLKAEIGKTLLAIGQEPFQTRVKSAVPWSGRWGVEVVVVRREVSTVAGVRRELFLTGVTASGYDC